MSNWRTRSKLGKVKVRYANGREETLRTFDLQNRPHEFVEYYGYLRSPEWQELRRKVLERDRGRCRRCHTDDQLHVHHVTYERLGKEWLSDLVTLCADCHRAHHEGVHPWDSPAPRPVRTKQPKPKATPVERARKRKRNEGYQALKARERRDRYARMWVEAQGGEVSATFTTRAEARTRPCPVCGVGAGEPCVGKRGPRRAVHAPRFVKL